MAQTIWKGVIRCDELRLPVRLYSAVQDRSIRFNLLHDRDRVRLKQRMVNPLTGKAVEHEAKRGYEVQHGLFVVLNDEELASAEPPASRDIEVLCFVKPEAVEEQWYDRPYFLGPDGDEASYFALVSALRREGLEGIMRWVMRRREYLGALREQDGYLALITLRHAGEVISTSELDAPEGRAFSAKELSMARQLVQALDGPFDPAEYHDEHRERVMGLVAAKARGESLQVEQPPPPKVAEESLEKVLQASLAAVH